MNVSCRPETPGDDSFVRQLILNTIAIELGAADWPEPLRNHLLGVQIEGRRKQYRGEIVQVEDANVGWIVHTTTTEYVHLTEIMILPELRGRGLGSAAIRLVQEDAARLEKPVRLHVNVMNAPAIRLYQRLGFRRIDGDPVQDLMEWDSA